MAQEEVDDMMQNPHQEGVGEEEGEDGSGDGVDAEAMYQQMRAN